MNYIRAILLVSLTIVSQSQMAFSQQPISQGEWAYKKGKPESVTIVYGTALTAEELAEEASARCEFGQQAFEMKTIEAITFGKNLNQSMEMS